MLKPNTRHGPKLSAAFGKRYSENDLHQDYVKEVMMMKEMS